MKCCVTEPHLGRGTGPHEAGMTPASHPKRHLLLQPVILSPRLFGYSKAPLAVKPCGASAYGVGLGRLELPTSRLSGATVWDRITARNRLNPYWAARSAALATCDAGSCRGSTAGITAGTAVIGAGIPDSAGIPDLKSARCPRLTLTKTVRSNPIRENC